MHHQLERVQTIFNQVTEQSELKIIFRMHWSKSHEEKIANRFFKSQATLSTVTSSRAHFKPNNLPQNVSFGKLKTTSVL